MNRNRFMAIYPRESPHHDMDAGFLRVARDLTPSTAPLACGVPSHRERGANTCGNSQIILQRQAITPPSPWERGPGGEVAPTKNPLLSIAPLTPRATIIVSILIICIRMNWWDDE